MTSNYDNNFGQGPAPPGAARLKVPAAKLQVVAVVLANDSGLHAALQQSSYGAISARDRIADAVQRHDKDFWHTVDRDDIEQLRRYLIRHNGVQEHTRDPKAPRDNLPTILFELGHQWSGQGNPAPESETPALPLDAKQDDGYVYSEPGNGSGSSTWIMDRAVAVWKKHGKASGMQYEHSRMGWMDFGDPSFSGKVQYRWRTTHDHLPGEKMTPDQWLGQLETQPFICPPTTLDAIASLFDETPKEITMNTTAIITVTTKTLLNGADINQYADSAIYNMIAEQEKAVAELESITNKPNRLVDEIAKRKAGIQALVDHLNTKDAPADAPVAKKK